MYYTYVLQSLKNHRFYIRYSDDLRRRLSEHNNHCGGKYTSDNAPFKLIFYEAYLDKRDTMEAERFFKTGYGREVLKDKIKNFLDSQNYSEIV